MCIYVYAYMYAICTRYVRDMHAAARALHSSTLKAARHFQSFTHYMHAAARALSLFHSQGSAAAPGHVGGERVCRTARAFEFAFESVGTCPVGV